MKMVEPSEGIPDQGLLADDVKSDESSLGWRAALPDDLKNHDMVKGFTKPGDAIRDYVKVKGESAGLIKIPTDQSTAEEKEAFLSKLGRPENAEKYDLKRPDGLTDENYNPQLENGFRQQAFENGLSSSQAAKLYGWYNDMAMKSQQSDKANTEAEINKLKDEWSGDKFKTNTAIASAAFKKFSKDDGKFLDTKINSIAIGNHPQFLKLFYEIGKLTQDDSALIRREGSGGQDSTDESKARTMFPSMIKKAV